MGKHTELDKDAAARIQSAGARNPDSDTAASGFDSRAQSAANRHEADRGGGAGGEPADPGEDEEENLEEIEARERWAEATEGHRLAAHYNLPIEVLEAIEVTEIDTYE
ncbi:hypothetical protein AB0M72_17155 [Nocardiopsis dassonvillei]|uniref:hypothetical protein n=1 Tax=Nocardiopsis dassonvillei TaxID=2014 RepID=UPI00200FC344|nr:hypothetical protein [Nocardiopsis dassonvillei]MCK9868866.1 hypothetical protein [Nocardiopsis dassonvillei]